MQKIHVFLILLIAGLTMVGAEIFIPGGVLGIFGGLALVAAIMMAFSYSAAAGVYATVGITILLGIVIVLWIRYFPRTSIGRQMTVANDLRESKSAESNIAALAGKTGQATSTLRPAGYAEIEGRRVDVVTDGEMIAAGSAIEVLRVEGNRIIVAAK
jgi:membrane-bound ClpP family serine protease